MVTTVKRRRGIGTTGIRGLAVTGAVAAAAAVWIVGEPILGYDLVVKQPGEEPRDLGLAAIAMFALVAALLGWALIAVLERVAARRARVIWTSVALLVLAVSLLPVFGVEASGGTKAVLAITHLAVAAVLIPIVWRTAPGGRWNRGRVAGVGSVVGSPALGSRPGHRR